MGQRELFPITHLRDIALSNPKQAEKLFKVLERNPKVIEYYLTTFILPQVGYALEQLTCTPAHLANGFCCSIFFTATPLAKQIYPQVIKEVRYDSAFEAEVVTEFCKEKNQKKIFVESPETFFTEMAAMTHKPEAPTTSSATTTATRKSRTKKNLFKGRTSLSIPLDSFAMREMKR